MLGDSRATGTKVCRNFTDCEPIVTQEAKDLSTSGISYGTENCVYSPAFSSNHVVTEMVTDELRMSMNISRCVHEAHDLQILARSRISPLEPRNRRDR
jgi:hypothetical protein